MDTRQEIKKLARIEEGPYPFLSLYLNTQWNDEQQRERTRLFTKNQLKKTYDQLKDRESWQKYFVEDQQQIERYVKDWFAASTTKGSTGSKRATS